MQPSTPVPLSQPVPRQTACRRMLRKGKAMPTKPMDQKLRIKKSVVITESDCWEWQLGRDSVGYGRMKVSMGSRDAFRNVSSHRYAWELWEGPIPHGMNVLHRCDNRRCCNPAHLFLGTQQENMLDMYAKGRGPKGYKRDPNICSINAKQRNK